MTGRAPTTRGSVRTRSGRSVTSLRNARARRVTLTQVHDGRRGRRRRRPTTVHRVLRAVGRFDRRTRLPSEKGAGVEGPPPPHQHLRVEIPFVTVTRNFGSPCATPVGFNRPVLHWELRVTMNEADSEGVVERVGERRDGVCSCMVFDSGTRPVAADVGTFIRLSALAHVRPGRSCPKSSRTRYPVCRTIHGDGVHANASFKGDEARRIVAALVHHYDAAPLHSAIEYITLAGRPAGRHAAITAGRDRRVKAAREPRVQWRRAARRADMPPPPLPCSAVGHARVRLANHPRAQHAPHQDTGACLLTWTVSGNDGVDGEYYWWIGVSSGTWEPAMCSELAEASTYTLQVTRE